MSGRSRTSGHGGPVLKTIWPEQAGAVKLARRFGAALVCVRYRRAADGRQRKTTVELVVAEAPIRRRWVAVRLPRHLNTAALRARAQALGAEWEPVRRVWLMSPRAADALGLAAHIEGPAE